jgi:hypothetical protein
MARRMVSFLVLGVFLAAPVLGGDGGPEGLLEGGHWKRLRAMAEAQVAANPNDARAANYLASAKEALGDLKGALPLAEKAVSADPNNARYHLSAANLPGREGAVVFWKGPAARRTLFPEVLDDGA